MRKSHWRLNPTPVEEHFIRQAAAKEGRPLSGMVHKLLSEAILARQPTEFQTKRVAELTSMLRGDAAEPDAQ